MPNTWHHDGREYYYDRATALRRLEHGLCPACGAAGPGCGVCLDVRLPGRPGEETQGSRLERWRSLGRPVHGRIDGGMA